MERPTYVTQTTRTTMGTLPPMSQVLSQATYSALNGIKNDPQMVQDIIKTIPVDIGN